MLKCSVENEITLLKQRLDELEKKEQENKEYEKINSLDYNFNVENIITKKKKNFFESLFKISIFAKRNDEQLVLRLEPIYNILKILAKKLGRKLK